MICMAEIRINVRTSAETKRHLKVAAKILGITPSSLVNFAVTRVIGEARDRDPAEFHRRVQLALKEESAKIKKEPSGLRFTDTDKQKFRKKQLG